MSLNRTKTGMESMKVLGVERYVKKRKFKKLAAISSKEQYNLFKNFLQFAVKMITKPDRRVINYNKRSKILHQFYRFNYMSVKGCP